MIQPTFPDSKRIKQYHGVFTQSGTSNPVVTILHNTIGTITWARTTTGIYTAISTGLFTEDKTTMEPFGSSGSTRLSLRGVTNSGGYKIAWIDENTIEIQVFTSVTGITNRDFSDIGGNLLIKISVYEN